MAFLYSGHKSGGRTFTVSAAWRGFFCEPMSNGWIKLHRQVLDNPFCKGSFERLGFWALLLLKANHETNEFYIGHQKIKCEAGEFVTGRNSLASECGVSPSKVHRWLHDLESEHQIEQQMHTKFRLIKVINWAKYQITEQQKEPQLNSKRTATEHKQEGKEIKKAYAVSQVTKTLHEYIDELCQTMNVENKVNIVLLDELVARYQNLPLRVEVRKCAAWLLDHGKGDITTSRITNWFSKAAEINKRQTNDLLVKRQERFSIDPAAKAKLLSLPKQSDA